MKVIVLLSGGMDSVTALYVARREHEVLAALSFDYRSKHNAQEIPFAQEHCRRLAIPHRLIDLGCVGEHFTSALLAGGGAVPDGHYEEATMKQTVVPFRNGIMLAIAAGLAESERANGIVIAAHSGDHAVYPDCREAFMAAMGEAVRLGTYDDIRILRPFIALDKGEIVRTGSRLGIDYSRTWSCYKGGHVHCGTCGTCVERREAFIQAGIPDPTDYQTTGPLPERPTVNCV